MPAKPNVLGNFEEVIPSMVTAASVVVSVSGMTLVCVRLALEIASPLGSWFMFMVSLCRRWREVERV